VPTETPTPLTVLITGATRRVGLAIARAFARYPLAHIILTTRDPESADALAARSQLQSLGARAVVERLDISDLTAVEAFGAGLSRSIEKLDVLIHNASAYDATPLESLSAGQLVSAMRVNAFAPALLTRGVLSLLRKSQRPSGAGVVALADMHVLGRPRSNLLAYSMSKAALVEMVQSLARELAPSVRVNAIAPGVIEWPESGAEAGPEFQQKYLARVPLARAGTPEDAAEAVRWLALDAAYTTGEVLRVDGGRWLA
jgi:pteridine reductase